MHLLDRATVIHYHRHRIAEHGLGTPGALGWREPRSQQARFEAIAAAADFSHARVLDIGCGTADLLPYLAERFDGIRYHGIDTVPEFIAHAAERHGPAHPGACFELGNAFDFARPLPPAEVVVACGALSYRSREPDFLWNALRHLWAASVCTLVFTVLDAAVFPEHPLLVGHDVAEVEGFCRRLTPNVRVLRGVAGDDVSFVLDGLPPPEGAAPVAA